MGAHQRIKRELKTVTVMIALYCKEHHHRTGFCPDCKELESYALERLNHCPFQERKTVCSKCPVHCYRPDMREKVRRVMRYSGPKMIYHHPFLAISHLIDKRRNEPISR